MAGPPRLCGNRLFVNEKIHEKRTLFSGFGPRDRDLGAEPTRGAPESRRSGCRFPLSAADERVYAPSRGETIMPVLRIGARFVSVLVIVGMVLAALPAAAAKDPAAVCSASKRK